MLEGKTTCPGTHMCLASEHLHAASIDGEDGDFLVIGEARLDQKGSAVAPYPLRHLVVAYEPFKPCVPRVAADRLKPGLLYARTSR
jgi:hypothetical protein